MIMFMKQTMIVTMRIGRDCCRFDDVDNDEKDAADDDGAINTYYFHVKLL